jgi:hypothetical protein
MTRTAHRAGAVVAAALLAALALGACSSNTSGSSTSYDQAGAPAPGMAPADPAAGEAAAPNEQKDGGTTSQQQAPAKVEPQQRSVIYTGTMSVKVDDVNQKAAEAISIVTGVSGVVGADKRTLDADRSFASLTLRVPADSFNATLDRLAKLGTEENRAITTEDVTEALIDIDARITTQRASVERVRTLLARANTVGEVVSIEGELTRREAELASLEQRKDRLSGLVSLSTITLTLRGPAAPAAPIEPETGFLAGLKSGWAAFLESVKVVLTIAGWLLPFALVVGIPLWIVLWYVRRRRRPVVTATPAPATPTAE